MANASQLLRVVRDILFRDWDPIGVNNNELCRNEYDSYAPELVRLLLSGADEHKLTSRLTEFQQVSMGMSVIDEEHNRRTASRLVTLVAETDAHN